jgi:hypothetical protein
MKVTRETVKKDEFLVTDYMYDNDNIGINLATLNQCKTNINTTLECVPIELFNRSFSNNQSNIQIQSKLINNRVDKKIQATFNIKYHDHDEEKSIDIDDEIFAQEMINTCILDKKDIKELNCYRNAISQVVEEIKASALENRILLLTNELNYKCYIYTEDLVLLGTANRLLKNSNGVYILGEYIGKSLKEYLEDNDRIKLIIDIGVTEDITLQMTNTSLINAVGSTFGYISIDTDNAYVRLIGAKKANIRYKEVNGFVAPQYKHRGSCDYYYEELYKANSDSIRTKYYKANKPKTSVYIDVNEYLMM